MLWGDQITKIRWGKKKKKRKTITKITIATLLVGCKSLSQKIAFKDPFFRGELKEATDPVSLQIAEPQRPSCSSVYSWILLSASRALPQDPAVQHH